MKILICEKKNGEYNKDFVNEKNFETETCKNMYQWLCATGVNVDID